MTVSTISVKTFRSDTGAPSLTDKVWLRANWHQIEEDVKRLQVRIAKATLEGRWGKVKALQRLLTRSYCSKMLAVKRVTENRGKRTPGVDGKIWSTPAAKLKGAQALKHRGYRPQPLRRIYIPKSNGKKRPLGIPTMRDRAMQALWKLALEPVAETLADPNSYGFRPNRSTADAVAHCFNALAKHTSAQWVLEADIRGCFDNISHDWLVRNIAMDKVILRKWLEAGYVEEGTFFATEAGTPQGGIISPVLANLTLDGLEQVINLSVASTDRTRRPFKVHVVRYADDFIVTGVSKDLLQHRVRPAIEAFLAERGLELSNEKTQITHISEGFDFLGQNVRKYSGKLLITPARKSVKALMDRVRQVVNGNKAATQANLILTLNPIIRGWAMYHRHVVSKARYAWVDHQVWRVLWRWAVRRHAMKGAKWIKQKYFHIEGANHWVFASDEKVNGISQRLRLFSAASVPIVRHIKIRSAVNPFDPAWAVYLERRQRSFRSDARFY
ncbi:group II intron reverse transcriptase/maturase [Marinobacterium iners]|uniref:group II intron reverse transcriptase/maturase n=1 Tax=Marinobacterium iners TaxID=48076 RepID=UPI001A8C14B5|nr:group II intron reverse transcriptase/maturase [Marinobacterium iners]QSR36750.1 group II intron reverse transcriptase/maturase [Marinobacterium iners]